MLYLSLQIANIFHYPIYYFLNHLFDQSPANQPVTNRCRGSARSPGLRTQDSVVPYLATDDRASIFEPRAQYIDTKNSKFRKAFENQRFPSLFQNFLFSVHTIASRSDSRLSLFVLSSAPAIATARNQLHLSHIN